MKGMKGEHVIDDTGDAKDTGAKENGIKLNKTWNGNKNMKH